MLYTSQTSTEESIIEKLAGTKRTVKELHEAISRDNGEHDISIQAVYQALGKLIDLGVVLKVKKKVELSNEWKGLVVSHFSEDTKLPQLKDGDSIAYSFSSFSYLDRYWKHTLLQVKGVEDRYPVFSFVPHEFWIYLEDRAESQKKMLRSYGKNGQYAFMCISSQTQFDKAYKRMFENEFFQIHLDSPLSKYKRTFFTVIKDYIIATRIPSGVMEQVEDLYKKAEDEQHLNASLNKIFVEPHRMNVKLTRDSDKARFLRKKASKYFFIPQNLRNEFKLF